MWNDPKSSGAIGKTCHRVWSLSSNTNLCIGTDTSIKNKKPNNRHTNIYWFTEDGVKHIEEKKVEEKITDEKNPEKNKNNVGEHKFWWQANDYL